MARELNKEIGPMKEAIDTVTKAVQALGYQAINPESLTALEHATHQWGWYPFELKTGIDELLLADAYSQVMQGLREMLGPKK